MQADNQHVFPVASIARFAQDDGRVNVQLLAHGRAVRLRPNDVLFCARRVWKPKSAKRRLALVVNFNMGEAPMSWRRRLGVLISAIWILFWTDWALGNRHQGEGYFWATIVPEYFRYGVFPVVLVWLGLWVWNGYKKAHPRNPDKVISGAPVRISTGENNIKIAALSPNIEKVKRAYRSLKVWGYSLLVAAVCLILGSMLDEMSKMGVAVSGGASLWNWLSIFAMLAGVICYFGFVAAIATLAHYLGRSYYKWLAGALLFGPLGCLIAFAMVKNIASGYGVGK